MKNALVREKVNNGIIVDASHGNSGKKWQKQIDVLKYIVRHCLENIRGIMMESFICNGNQSLSAKPLQYGLSVTDECIGWEKSLEMFRFIEKQIK